MKQVADYGKYLRSKHWKRIKKRYADDPQYQNCKACGASRDGTFQHHHRTYERLWCEEIDDIVILCQPCHSDLHREYDQLKVANAGKTLAEHTDEFCSRSRKKYRKTAYDVEKNKSKMIPMGRLFICPLQDKHSRQQARNLRKQIQVSAGKIVPRTKPKKPKKSHRLYVWRAGDA